MNLEELIIPLTVKDMASTGIDKVTASLGGLKTGFLAVGAAIAAVGAAAVALGAMAVKATFEWADELDHLQDVTGVTNKQAAALNFTLRKSGVATDTLAKGMTILEKGLVKADGTLDTTGKELHDWGINVLDANGSVKDQAALLDEISRKYQSFGTQQERVNFLTGVFGRSGADLVDFFDTLAGEGGIDAVTAKVEKFGLAIDPGRYEAFNRNLNELKLIGTGLAVQFTEKLMPVLEGVLSFFNKFAGMSPEQMFANVENLLSWLPAKFQNWAQRIDWQKVSQDIINGINSIDWAGLGERVRIGFGQIMSGLGTIVSKIDWKGIFSAAGKAFLDFMAGLTNQGTWQNVKNTWSNNFNQLKDIASKIWSEITNTIKGWIDKIKTAIASIPTKLGLQTSVSTYRTPGRASGGPVVAGQSYQVAEFSKPEIFTPNTGGRIDQKESNPVVTVQLDEKRLARAFAQELQTMGIF